MTTTNYAYTVTLLDRGQKNRTPINQNPDSTHAEIDGGDITSWVVRIEYENTGIKKMNNAEISLRMDSLGTFFRTDPNFFTSAAKTQYLIELQISQVINGVTTNGKIFRGEIGEPSIQEDESVGELIRLPLRDIAYSTKETPVSAEDIFLTPYGRFFNLALGYYTHESGSPPPGNHSPGVQLSIGTLNLPNDESLKQNWTPNDPTYVHDLMEEVINRLASPSSQGGTFTDYYFDFDSDLTTTLLSLVTADAFGAGSSVATINSDTIDSANPSALQEKTILNDNTRYKNNGILICHPSAGTLPMNLCKFASNWAHGIVRPEWSPSGIYTGPSITTQPSLVKVTNTSDPDVNKRIRFFKCIANIGPAGLPPQSDPGHWIEDFSTNPLSSSYINYTPWTNLTEFTSNLAGTSNIPFGYAGYFYDYNIARALYDPSSRQDPTNAFANLSMKFVTRISNTVPSDVTEFYNGQRILVGLTPSGTFSGHANQIAQWDSLGIPGGGWQFSNAPTAGDTVYNLEKAQVLSFNPPASAWNGNNPNNGISYVQGDLVTFGGVIYQCIVNIIHSIFNNTPDHDGTHWLLVGNWVPVWGHDSSINRDTHADLGGSPFHPCATLQTITGATGVPNAALRATYNWVDENAGGQFIHRASRGVWLSFMFPYPRITNANGVCGHIYGGGATNTAPIISTLDSNNMNYTSKANLGWNLGGESEDLGKISGIHFKMKVGLFASSGTDESQPVDFIADIPMTFWAVDLFDRVYYYDFKLRRNNQWELVEIPFGYNAPQQLYFSRGDELPKLLQYTLPWDFTLKEKEYTGVQFDWKFVKAFGFQMKQPYTSQSGMYMAGQDPFFGEMIAELQQLGANIYNAIADPVSKALFNTPSRINTFVNHSAISIDELCFTKELIVNSDDSIVPFARTKIDFRETEKDYLSAKSQAQGIKYRGIFYPQFWHIRAKGDVRLRFGKNFTIVGSRVPNGTLTLAVQSVKHIIDHTGYNVEIMGVNKFNLQTNAIDYQYYSGA